MIFFFLTALISAELTAGDKAAQRKIADNYLSLKAYAVSSAGRMEAYVKNYGDKKLSSIGDLLQLVASKNGSALRRRRTEKALLKEYASILVELQGRWKAGVG